MRRKLCVHGQTQGPFRHDVRGQAGLPSCLCGWPPNLLGMLFVAFYGDCFDSEECHRGGGVRFLLVIVLTLGVTITVGLVTRKLVNAWLDERR